MVLMWNLLGQGFSSPPYHTLSLSLSLSLSLCHAHFHKTNIIYFQLPNISARYRCQARRSPGGELMYPFEGEEEEPKSAFFFPFFFSIPALQRRPAILGRNRHSPRRGWGALGMPIYQNHVSKNRHSAGIGSKPFQ